ncbi:MAG: type I DNA topoisomerase [Candidatus Aminicenantes bacterium]|nr:type I DNA topoisomerase [Candidatus Aminicenantes bacterium]
MAKHLVIVESPAKAKTVNRYLGKDYLVKASWGHIRDLPKTRLGVDVEKDFEPEFQIIPIRKKIVAELQQAADQCDSVLLAADPDREGEAICWHLSMVLKDKSTQIYRMLFHEITKPAVAEALKDLRKLDENKIKAQQTRRILDRLVGYSISPLLWKKIGSGLSAGRVQSVALRLICEREKEITDFKQEEFWTIAASLQAAKPPPFKANLVKIQGKKAKVNNEGQAQEIVSALEKVPFILEDVQVKEKKKNPSPPYITSTLQQEGFRQLRFPVKKTMMVAQRLYEGKEIGDESSVDEAKGLVGLITYMRTDSVRISDGALQAGRKYIAENFAAGYLPSKPRIYKNKRKAQDAHEAIRPTSFDLSPDVVAPYLDRDELRLYSMIWKRFLASQMSPALVLETQFDIAAAPYQFKAKGEVIKFDGFLALFAPKDKDKDEMTLPSAEPGEKLRLLGLDPKQNFTQPPPRYTEGSLVMELEAKGIGRPSTYVPIISTLLDRDYVTKEKGKFIPREIGVFVNDYLIQNFPDLMQFEFTAQLEEKLDQISEGKDDWLEYLKSYYELLKKDLEQAAQLESFKGKGIPSADICPECKKPLVIKEGRFGRFKACSGFPECKYKQGMEKREVKMLDENCPDCGSQLVLRDGRYGPFTACSNYPNCKYIKTDQKDTGIGCPECDGTIVRKKTRKGKIFYGCSNYPKCKFATWDEPLEQACPQCERKFILRKKQKSGMVLYYCNKQECEYKEEKEE